MNKADIIDKIATEHSMAKAQAERIVSSVFSSIGESLSGGERVDIHGFGSFEVSERAARTGRNPQTGEAIQIEASKGAKFKAGKNLRDLLNQ